MFEKIVAPLDGSPLSEAVLPWVRQLVARGNTRAHLVRVVSRLDPGGVACDGFVAVPNPIPTAQERAEIENDARKYLAQLAEFVGNDEDVRTLVRVGEPAREIVAVAREIGADLIAMSTHGRTGLGRLVLGSVADQVVRMSGMPVVLIRPDEAALRATPAALNRGLGAVPHPGRRPLGL